MARRRRPYWLNLRGFVVPVALIVAAQAGAVAVDLQSDSLARPSAILIAGYRALVDGTFFTATAQTLTATFGGLVIGGSGGVVLGAILARWRNLDRTLFVPIELLRPMPPIALMPLALLVFGFGYSQEIAVVAFATLWPALILTRAAVLGVDRYLFEVMRLLELRPWQAVTKILLPAILPRLLVALRISLGIAIVVAVSVEIVVNPLGLGYQMMRAQESLHPALAFAFLVWIGIVGWAINAVLVRIQERASPGIQAGGPR